jgi:hypothetical protein
MTLTSQARMAEALYTRAIRAADESAGGGRPRLVTGLLLGHAESLIELGRHREATGPASRARRLAADTGDEPLQARALLTLGASSPTSATTASRGSR